MIIAVVAALAAGACFAAGGVLQQRVAATRPEGQSLSLGLLKDLARQRLWVIGIVFAFLSYGFQSLALAFGPLALVQPLIVSELLFALPLSARLYGASLGARDWLGVAATGGGLALALLAAAPRGGDAQPPLSGWLVLLLVVGVIAGGALLVGRQVSGAPRASLYALAGATVMGSQSALLDNTLEHLQEGFVSTVSSWQTYLLIIASIGGLLLIQSAFQAGPLSASLPVIDATQPLVAVAIGVTLFGEAVRTAPLPLTLVLTGVAASISGIVLLDTSPAMHKLHEKQRRAAEEQDPQEQVSLG